MKNIKNTPVEELQAKIVREQLAISSLDQSNPTHMKALLGAIKERNVLIKQITGSKAENTLLSILKSSKDAYKFFIQLNESQYTDKLLQFYLYCRLQEDNAVIRNAPVKENKEDVKVGKSLDDKITFTFSCATAEDDRLNYMDKDIGIPLALKSSFKITLKLNDSLKLLEKLDTHISSLGAQRVKEALSDIITTYYKAALASFIQQHNLGYYSLNSTLATAQASICEALANAFSPYGIEVSDFLIKNIAIPADIQNKVENLSFALRQNRAEMEAEAELARMSLKNYEEKLAIQQKFPDTEHSLTEYEKDLALKRYMTKVGRNQEETVDRSIKIKKQELRADSVIEKQRDVRPSDPKKKSHFMALFFGTLIPLLVIVISIMASEQVGAGLVMLGFIFLIYGPIAAFNTHRFKKAPQAAPKAAIPQSQATEGDK